MPRRLLHIIPTLDRGGAEKQLTLLATHLPRDEFDVHVCALTRGGPLLADLEAAEIPVTVIGKSWKLDPMAYWNLLRHIQALAPDIVQTWLFAANSYGRHAASQAGVPAIYGSERCVDRWKAWHELMIDRYLAGLSRRIVVNSDGVSDFYTAAGIPAEKFVTIPNGIGPYAPREQVGRDELLAELALPVDAKLIGVIGRLWPQKRVKDMIWAADLMNTIRDDTHVLIIGDGPERWRLERYRDQIETQRNVHFLGERGDVPRLLEHLDVVWLGSEYEGLPNVVMEAMAAGRPVVATDIPGNRDLVVEGETGYLIHLGDRAEFARRTNALFNDPALAARLGAAARERVAREFSVERMVERFARLYRE